MDNNNPNVTAPPSPEDIYKSGHSAGYANGRRDGYAAGFQNGYSAGFEDGKRALNAGGGEPAVTPVRAAAAVPAGE